MFLSVSLLPDCVEFLVYSCLSSHLSPSVSYNHVKQLFYCNGDHAEHQMTPYLPVSFDSDMSCAVVVLQIRVSPFHCRPLAVSALFRRRKRDVFTPAFIAVYDWESPLLRIRHIRFRAAGSFDSPKRTFDLDRSNVHKISDDARALGSLLFQCHGYIFNRNFRIGVKGERNIFSGTDRETSGIKTGFCGHLV